MEINRVAPVGAPGLTALLRPGRVAMIGASERNIFSRRGFAQFLRIAGHAPDSIVNPRSPEVFGVPTVPTCADVEGGFDLAWILTPAAATLSALEDAAAAGARAAVVMGSGWAEEGAEGSVRQAELLTRAEALGITFTGPNHLGYANLVDGIAPTALGLELPSEPGPLAMVTQSGAVGSSLVGYAARQDVRFSYLVTTGNEAMVSVADVVDWLVDDESTRSIAVFAETIRKPELFRAAVQRAAERGKAVVVLKAGSSSLAAQTAQAHTGALVGDDRVIDAVFRQDGVIRVRTPEDLISTADLAGRTGPLRAGGVGVLSASGGACDLIADLGEVAGLDLPALSPATRDRLQALLPSYGHAQNPLDVTGGAVADMAVWRGGVEAFADEPGIGLVGVVTSLPRDGEPQRAATFQAVGDALAATGLKGVILPQVEQPISEHIREVKAATGIENVLPSVDRFVTAAAALGRWSTYLLRRRSGATVPPTPAIAPLEHGVRLSEADARVLLEAGGVPLVPATLARSQVEAVAAARTIEGPVVLKLCSAEVAHKTELGGVLLGLDGDDAVADGFVRLERIALDAEVALQGVLVSPMRSSGLELLVGVTRDPSWGLVLAVAFGGALVELLQDSAVRVLPVTADDVDEMIGELRGARLLDGYRGSAPADRRRLRDAVLAIAAAATALGPALDSIEVNPLVVGGERIEGLDALVVTRARW